MSDVDFQWTVDMKALYQHFISLATVKLRLASERDPARRLEWAKKLVGSIVNVQGSARSCNADAVSLLAHVVMDAAEHASQRAKDLQVTEIVDNALTQQQFSQAVSSVLALGVPSLKSCQQ